MTTPLYTASRAAELLGMSRAWVPLACRRLGIQPVLGRFLLSDADLALLRNECRPRGNPTWPGQPHGAGLKKKRKRGKKQVGKSVLSQG